MAESSVEILLVTLAYMLQKKNFVLGGVHGEISKIKLELESMRSFLRDAEKWKEQHEGVSAWVTQVMDVALRAEDAIDEFLYHSDSLKKHGFKGCFSRTLSFPKEVWLTQKTAAELKRIKHEIVDIAKRSKRYDLTHIEGSHGTHHALNYEQNIGEISYFMTSDEVVGLHKEEEKLLGLLTGGQMQRSVISIVGMGGSGKTTLVAKAFNSKTVKRFFDCYAWISVYQKYVVEDLLRKMITEFFDGKKELVPPSLGSMDYKQLVGILVHFLQEKKYLIVFDDVWNSSFWRQLSVALPDNKNGSRVMITTRNQDIASYPYGVGSHVLHSEPLSSHDSWTLFCSKAFCGEPNFACPPELEDISRALIAKCEGLPLAIISLAGLMASKERSEIKWKEVYNSLNWHISNNPMLDDVKSILLLSFNSLPYYLKNCFLYCCRFPRERWIGAGKLIRMWMAEGFLEENRGGLIPEDVGKIYLRELISKNLLQVQKHHSFLRPKLCKLHDMLWELALSLSEREHFSSVCEDGEIKARRISLHSFEDTQIQFGEKMKSVRSFAAFNFKKDTTVPIDELLSSFKLLRVLELQDAPITSLPKVIGRLFNLRYLCLKGTRITELPTTVKRLRNLQTLDIRKTNVKVLPVEVCKLFKLRHLLTYSGSAGEDFNYITGVQFQVRSKVWKLKNLRVLNCIDANEHILKAIGKMTQLRRLELTNLRKCHESYLCASLGKLQFLRHLLLMVESQEETFQLDLMVSAPSALRKLTLVGRLNKVPEWFPSLRNVIHLHLHWSRLTEDPIPYLNELPSLERLALVNAYFHGKKQLCFNAGFLKLEVLHIAIFPELVEITIKEGVMPSLACLNLHVCPKMKKVPQGIEHLLSCGELHLKEVSSELVESIREGSADHPRVRHIPVIMHSYRTVSGHCYESLS